MTTQEQAEQLARKCVSVLAGSEDARSVEEIIQDTIPLLELLEVARAANELERTYTSDGVDVYETNKLCKALQSLRETGFEI